MFSCIFIRSGDSVKMADQQEIFAVILSLKGTVNGVLDQIERERRNLKSENEELKKENTFLKTKIGTVNGVLDQIERERRNLKSENEELKKENTLWKTKIEEKGNKFQGEIKNLNTELAASKKTIELLDPTGTGQRIVNYANLFQTKEIDKLTEKIVGLEAKSAKQLELIEVLQRVEFELPAESTKTSRVEGANSVEAVDRIDRKRKAEKSFEVIEKQSRIEK